MGMQNDTNIANLRTAFTAAWTGIVIYVLSLLGWTIDVTNPTVILILGALGAIVWRVAELLARIPYLGYILFGVNKEPSYNTTPPPLGTPVPQDDAGIVTNDTVWTIVGILAIVALVIWIAARV